MANFSGHVFLRAEGRKDGPTVLAAQSFRAPFHLSKPYWDGHALIVQVVNPTAGVLSGDVLTAEVRVTENAAMLVTTPSATRVFQMKEGAAECHQHLRIDDGGWLEYWPEPLILHQGSRYTQTTLIEAGANAEFFYGDFLLPGRIARGEAWAWSQLCLDLRVTIGGQLILRERFDQTGEALKRLAKLAGAGSGAGFGNLIIASAKLQETDTWRAEIAALHGPNLWLGVSRLRGSSPAYAVKFIAQDGEGLRNALARIRQALRPFLPRLASDPRKL